MNPKPQTHGADNFTRISAYTRFWMIKTTNARPKNGTFTHLLENGSSGNNKPEIGNPKKNNGKREKKTTSAVFISYLHRTYAKLSG
jgi:hypothetical protein